LGGRSFRRSLAIGVSLHRRIGILASDLLEEGGAGDGSEATDAGVGAFGGGLKDHEEASVVATDGTVTDDPYPEGRQYSADSRYRSFCSGTIPTDRVQSAPFRSSWYGQR
jgi:hypothetical protein